MKFYIEKNALPGTFFVVIFYTLMFSCDFFPEKMQMDRSECPVSSLRQTLLYAKNDLLKLPCDSESISEQTSMDKQILAQGLKDVFHVDPTLARDYPLTQVDSRLTVHIEILESERITGIYLQPEAAEMLRRANTILKKRYPSYRLFPVSGVRPRSIQVRLYREATPEQRQYLASPGKGSLHNYGAAIDLTIVDVIRGKEINMGSPMGALGEISNSRHEQNYLKQGILNEKHIQNRRLLRSVMREAGFHSIAREWWHYNSAGKEEIRSKYSIVE